MTGGGEVDGLEVFAAERPRLLGLAYRTLGSMADAEDVVQEAWLRWQTADQSGVERPAAWLTTVTSHLALDRLRALSRRREDYVGPWLPEPVATTAGPEAQLELAESLTLGFLVMLDRLGPVDRVVFLLADVFGESYTDIARAVGRSEDACRQIASRARKRVRDDRRSRAGEPLEPGVVELLLQAVGSGDADAVASLLTDDAVLVSDGGAHFHVVRRPVLTPSRIARLLVNLASRVPAGVTTEIVTLNGEPAAVMRLGGHPFVVINVATHGGRIRSIGLVVNPDKLGHLDTPVALV